jgi:hypothetical protein
LEGGMGLEKEKRIGNEGKEKSVNECAALCKLSVIIIGAALHLHQNKQHVEQEATVIINHSANSIMSFACSKQVASATLFQRCNRREMITVRGQSYFSRLPKY